MCFVPTSGLSGGKPICNMSYFQKWDMNQYLDSSGWAWARGNTKEPRKDVVHTLFGFIYLFYSSFSGLLLCFAVTTGMDLFWICDFKKKYSPVDILQLRTWHWRNNYRVIFLLLLWHRTAFLEVPNSSISCCVVFWASFIQFALGSMRWLYFQSSSGTVCTCLATILKGNQ